MCILDILFYIRKYQTLILPPFLDTDKCNDMLKRFEEKNKCQLNYLFSCCLFLQNALRTINLEKYIVHFVRFCDMMC